MRIDREAAFRQTGADAPCESDASAEEQARYAAEKMRGTALTMAAVVILAAIIFWGLSRW